MYTDGHTLSLHDALPMWRAAASKARRAFKGSWARSIAKSSIILMALSRNDALSCGASLGISGSEGRSKRTEEHTSELQSLMRISYAVFILKKKKKESMNTKHSQNRKTRE